MPQLNPHPWFIIFIFSWLVFLVLIPSKILGLQFPNDLTTQSTEQPKTEPWSWPWY